MQLEEKSYDINKIIEMEDNPVNEDNGENGDNNENRENKEKNERCSDASYTYWPSELLILDWLYIAVNIIKFNYILIVKNINI